MTLDTDSEKMMVVHEEYLPVNQSCDGQVPCCVGGHAKTQKRPNTIVVEGGYEHCSSAASSKYISPGPLIQLVIDVVYITVLIKNQPKQLKPTDPRLEVSEFS